MRAFSRTKIFEKIEPGSGQKLIKFIEKARKKYEIGMNDFVYRPSHSPLEFINFKVLKGLLDLNVFSNFRSYVKKYFKNETLVQLMEFPVLFLGATPENTPALYSLMNYSGLYQGTYYPMGGFNEIISALVSLAKEKGVEIICNSNVEKINIDGDSAIEEIIRDCGLWDSLQFPKESSNKNRFVLHKNKLTKIPITPLKFIFSRLFSFSSKIRILKEFLVKPHNENKSVYEFIKKRFGEDFHNKLIEPFITGIYAGNTKKMSAKHTLKMLWRLEQDHGSIIKGIFKSKRDQKGKINSFNFPNGLSSLISKIANSIDDKLIFNFSVNAILKTQNGYEIIMDEYQVILKKTI